MKKRWAVMLLGCSLAVSGLMMASCGSTEEKTSGGSVKTEAAKETKDKTEKEDAEDSLSDLKGAVKIKDADDLLEFAERVNAGETELNAVLADNIDLSTVCGENAGSWTPIADYNGTFDGAGYSIRNLYVTGGTEDYVGLFADSGEMSVIANLILEDVQIEGGKYTGAVIALTEGAVRNCRVSGKVEGYYVVGGIVGSVSHTGNPDSLQNAVESCVNSAEVRCGEMERNGAAGGIAGKTNQHMKDCRNDGFVHGKAGFTGGIAGEAEGTYYDAADYMVRIENCHNSGEVDGVLFVGGITGYLSDGFIGNCENTGDVLGYCYLGGICGVQKGQVEKGEFLGMIVNCANTGDIRMYPLGTTDAIKYESKKGSANFYDDQAAAGIAAVSEKCIVMNCRNAGNLICDTNKYKIDCSAAHIAADFKQNSVLFINCLSTAEITPPSVDPEDFISNGVTVTGNENPENCAAAVFYTGEPCYDNLTPTDPAALTDGTVLAQLNAFPDGVPAEFMTRIQESGISYELCGWKQGADGPVLEWEE